MYQTRIICPRCKKEGYLIREKPRKKHETPTLRGWKNSGLSWFEYCKSINKFSGYQLFENRPHQPYPDTRKPGRYYKFLHKIKNAKGKWTNKTCYIGNIELHLEKYKNENTDNKGNIFTDAKKEITKIESLIKEDPIKLTQNDINQLYKWKSRPKIKI
ncbi:MAG: hypothetical protein KGI28_01595 [Thaumarchaeota archaeon]|nr:hypothetical protein [Nitrososphaerota archaeon]